MLDMKEMSAMDRAVDIFALELKSLLHKRYSEARQGPDEDGKTGGVLHDVIKRALEEVNPDVPLDNQEDVVNEALTLFLLWCINMPDSVSAEERLAS